MGNGMRDVTREDRAIMARVATRAGRSGSYSRDIRKLEELDYRRTFRRLYHCAHPTVGAGTPPSLSAQVKRNIDACLEQGWVGMGLAVY